jgi:uncharacterized SAM-dependent methyltransferase
VLDHPRRVEAHLVAERPIHYQLDGLVGTLAPGESIHTDTSYKMKPEIFQALAVQGGWSPLRCWSDDGGLFNLHLLRARSSTEA